MKIEKKHHARTYVALLVLTLLTFALSYAKLGDWGPVIGMLIAAAKALLVAGFFMHLLEEHVSNRLVFATAVGMFCLLVFFTTFDVHTREVSTVVPPDVKPLGPER